MAESVILSINCPTLIGRATHLATLQQFIEQTKRGMGHGALISGEAGIGKSRLVAEAKTYAAQQGFCVLQGNCFPTDITYPYAPLLDLLRTLFASKLVAIPAAKLDMLAREIFPLLPELVPEQTVSLSTLDPEQEKHRLFAVLANFFIDLATRSPILFVIEDVHWSDRTSLDFLHYLVRHSVSHPFFLLVTYRLDEVRPELRSWLAQLNRERLAQEIQLVPLSRTDLDAMFSAIFEQRHTSLDMRRFLHGELLDALYTLTEGNPFFVEETLSSLIAQGDIFYSAGYWNRKALQSARIPRSVQDAVQRRTEQLGEAARHVLTLAAAAGRHFDFVLLERLTQYDEHQLIGIMKELLSAQLVVEESAEQFAFRHALTRQAIYTQLLTRERTVLHRTIAETMEQFLPAALDAHLEDLAYHFYQGRRWQKALDYTQRAGEKALHLYSHRAAIDYFTWALDAAEHLALPPIPSLFHARGQAYEMLGEFEQAQQNYTLALDAARTINDRVAEWQSLIALGFLWTGRDYTRTETWFRQALLLAESLADPALHARSLNRIGNWHLNVEQPIEALRYHREALTIFQSLPDIRGIAETLDLLGMTSYLGGDLISGTDHYQQAVAIFQELGDKAGLTSSMATLTLRGPTFQTYALVSAASLAEALRDAENAVSIAREIGHRSAEAYALFQLGLCLGSQGEYEHALAAGQQSLDIAEEIEHRQWQTSAHTVLGGIYSGLLAYAQAREHFERALALATEIGSLVWTRVATGYLSSAAIQLHDLSQAEKLLHVALILDPPAQTMAQSLPWFASVELALAQGHPSRALALIEQWNSSTAQTTTGQSSLRALKLRAEVLVALQRPAEAEAAFQAALAMVKSLGVRPLQWRICIALGNLYTAQGRNTEAEPAFATARTLIEELAATINDEPLRDNFFQMAISMLPHTGPLSTVSSFSPKHAAKQAYGGLTERERAVAALIAQGKSNQEIADTLIVTKRTVETHIGNIMFKLGHSSRTQIAVWATEKGL